MKVRIHDFDGYHNAQYVRQVYYAGGGPVVKVAGDWFYLEKDSDGSWELGNRASLGGEKPTKTKKNSGKRSTRGGKRPASKRISTALTRWLKKQNPAMKKARAVRVQRLKGGVIKFTPEK